MCLLVKDFLSGDVGAVCNADLRMSYRFFITFSLFAY